MVVAQTGILTGVDGYSTVGWVWVEYMYSNWCTHTETALVQRTVYPVDDSSTINIHVFKT